MKKLLGLLGQTGVVGASVPANLAPSSFDALGTSSVITNTTVSLDSFHYGSHMVTEVVPYAGQLWLLYSDWTSGPGARHILSMDPTSGVETDWGVGTWDGQGFDNAYLAADGNLYIPSSDRDLGGHYVRISAGPTVTSVFIDESLNPPTNHMLDVIEWNGVLYMSGSGDIADDDKVGIWSSTDYGATWTVEFNSRVPNPGSGVEYRGYLLIPDGAHLRCTTGDLGGTNPNLSRTVSTGWVEDSSVDPFAGYGHTSLPSRRRILSDGSSIYGQYYIWRRNRLTAGVPLLHFVPGSSAAVEVAVGTYAAGSFRVRAWHAAHGYVWAAIRATGNIYDELWRAVDTDLSTWTLICDRLPWCTTAINENQGTLYIATTNAASNYVTRVWKGSSVTGSAYNPLTDIRATTSAGNTGTSITVAKPAGTLDGDLMVAVITRAARTNAIVVPSGWTLVNGGSFSGTFDVHMYFKIASSEGASYVWSHSAPSDDWAGVIESFAGVYDASNCLETSAILNDSTNLYTSPILTVNAWEKRLYVAALGIEGGRTITAATGWTIDATHGQVVNGSATTMLATCDTAIGAGDTVPADFTLSALAQALFISAVFRRGGSGPGTPPAEALIDSNGDAYINSQSLYLLRA